MPTRSAIIQEIERMHAAGLATMAYYYFDFRDVKKQGCDGLPSSLILQLFAGSDSCYNILSQLYSDNSCGIRKPSISALEKCLKDMLSLSGQGPIYIVVDALDECPNFPGRPSAREKVLDLIEELVDLKLPNVHSCQHKERVGRLAKDVGRNVWPYSTRHRRGEAGICTTTFPMSRGVYVYSPSSRKRTCRDSCHSVSQGSTPYI